MQMMASNIVGEVWDPRKKLSVDWNIQYYFSLSHKTDSCYDSHDFRYANSTWCIRIFPNGERSNDSVELIGLYLKKQIPVLLDKCLTVKLGIKYPDGTIYKSRMFQKNFYESTEVCGCHDFMDRRSLLQLKSDLAPTGIMTIFCSINCDGELADGNLDTEMSLLDNMDILSRDFRELFLSGQRSDVKFGVDGTTFKAHKVILEARSPVFTAMFHHDMTENNNGIVDIVNCSSDAFRNFLLFMYTGRIENSSFENIANLYSLADKYQMKELKEQCYEFMMNCLNIDTVCDIIALTNRHNEENLKASAKEFIVKNIKGILPTEKWKLLMKENTMLAVELLMAALPDTSLGN